MTTTATKPNITLVCTIHKNDTDEVLIREMIKMDSIMALHEHKIPFILSINGCDHDSRELWEIPEITKLAERLVTLGFISLLAVSTLLGKQTDTINKYSMGALEVWLLSKGFLKSECTITENMFNSFREVLLKSRGPREIIIWGNKNQ